MKLYKVTVSTPGHKLVHRSKVVRTPVTFHRVTESEATVIKTQAKASSLECEISEEFESAPKTSKKMKEDFFEDIQIDEKKETIIEHTSILEGFLNEK